MSSSTFWDWTKNFFVNAAYDAQHIRWRHIFELAWDDKGFVVELTQVPGIILNQFIEWRNERVEEENAKAQQHP